MKMLVPMLAALAFAGCAAPAPEPRVSEARVRLPAAPGLPAAGYFTVEGFSSREVLTGASSPAAERIEMHLTRSEDDVSRMQRVVRVDLGRTSEFRFEPGAHHLMLYGLSQELRPGGAIALTLTFEKAAPVIVQARLEAPGGGDAHTGH